MNCEWCQGLLEMTESGMWCDNCNCLFAWLV